MLPANQNFKPIILEIVPRPPQVPETLPLGYSPVTWKSTGRETQKLYEQLDYKDFDKTIIYLLLHCLIKNLLLERGSDDRCHIR